MITTLKQRDWLMLATRGRFLDLCERLGARDNPIIGRTIDGTYNELVTAYTGPDRHYHNIRHISEGLALLDEARPLAKIPDILEMAWWWHDFVYYPGSNSNEEDSAKAANRALTELALSDGGLGATLRPNVIRLIRATKHDLVPLWPDDRLIVDIDLVSLALSPERFDENTAKNREEYRIVVPNDRDFEIGRAQFFRKFLEGRLSIYLTQYFRDKYEAQAQENIRRLIAKAGI